MNTPKPPRSGGSRDETHSTFELNRDKLMKLLGFIAEKHPKREVPRKTELPKFYGDDDSRAE